VQSESTLSNTHSRYFKDGNVNKSSCAAVRGVQNGKFVKARTGNGVFLKYACMLLELKFQFLQMGH
jgi:hypothetical protein